MLSGGQQFPAIPNTPKKTALFIICASTAFVTYSFSVTPFTPFCHSWFPRLQVAGNAMVVLAKCRVHTRRQFVYARDDEEQER